MSEISDRYARRASAFAEKVAAVSGDQWGAPSPCEDWSARYVVRHVVESQGRFLEFVGREMGDLPSGEDDPEAAVRESTGRILEDLGVPDLAAETFEGFFGVTAFEVAVDRFLSADLLIHGWDLARATGQDDTIAPVDLAEMQEAMKLFPEEAMRSPGAFGPEVEVADDASDQDKLMGFLGRKP